MPEEEQVRKAVGEALRIFDNSQLAEDPIVTFIVQSLFLQVNAGKRGQVELDQVELEELLLPFLEDDDDSNQEVSDGPLRVTEDTTDEAKKHRTGTQRFQKLVRDLEGLGFTFSSTSDPSETHAVSRDFAPRSGLDVRNDTCYNQLSHVSHDAGETGMGTATGTGTGTGMEGADASFGKGKKKKKKEKENRKAEQVVEEQYMEDARTQKQREAERLEQLLINDDSAAEITKDFDDFASAWEKCRDSGRVWGGKSFGGRGIQQSGPNSSTGNAISLSNVSLAFASNVLLEATSLVVVRAHCYGLVGANGVGKSTLLKSINRGTLPGWPQDMKPLFVGQEVPGTSETALEIVSRFVVTDEEISNGSAARILGQEEAKQDVARDILMQLDFDEHLLGTPTKTLSGGWRMRVALATAIAAKPDILLLDEPDNHLDVAGKKFLEQYLTDPENEMTSIVISHDRSFLRAITTDVIVMRDKQLAHFRGNYAEFEEVEREKALADNKRFAAAERQRKVAQASVEKQKQTATAAAKKGKGKGKGKGKYVDDKKLKQAKVKEQKMERIGWYREDGKRYKTRSLKEISEDALRLPQHVQAAREDPTLRFHFPDPPLVSKSKAEFPFMTLQQVTLAYRDNMHHAYSSPAVTDTGTTTKRTMEQSTSGMNGKFQLRNVSLSLYYNSHVALIGINGSGKSSLLRFLLEANGYIDPANTLMTSTKGTVTNDNRVKFAFVSQYHVDLLRDYAESSAVQYMMDKLSDCQTEEKARQHLGRFGLTGSLALKPIYSLSGGQRSRLLFAHALWGNPSCVILDEPTNHLEMAAIIALEEGLKNFQGSFIIVSHDEDFLKNTCQELWVVENGTVRVAVDHPTAAYASAVPPPSLSSTSAAAATDSNAGDAKANEEWRAEIQDNFAQVLSEELAHMVDSKNLP